MLLSDLYVFLPVNDCPCGLPLLTYESFGLKHTLAYDPMAAGFQYVKRVVRHSLRQLQDGVQTKEALPSVLPAEKREEREAEGEGEYCK